MIYLDTSVLLVHTLTQSVEVERSRSVRKLFAKINSRLISAATSFYALHEVHVFAIENSPTLDLGFEFGKTALQEILKTPIRILPFVTRMERRRMASRFASLRDASDLPHAISAYASGCEAIVAYDDHFKAIDHVISYKKPEDYL